MIKITTIHARINLMMYILGVIFLLLLFKLYLTTNKQEKLVLNESRTNFQNEVNSLITNKTELLKQVANDYTYWDDFVNHMTKSDTAWFRNNITTILKSFRIDYATVFDSSFNQIHEAFVPEISSRSFITKEMLKNLKEKRFSNFFLTTPEGIFEISAASVHTEDDPTHLLTLPRGYLFLAYKLNKAALENFFGMSNVKITLSLPYEPVEPIEELSAVATFQLKDCNNQPIAELVFNRTSNLLYLYRETSIYMILTMLISIIITWIVINFAFRKWLTKPLKLVTQILETEKPQLIEKLKKCPGEFKQMGSLFSDFVDQKKELIKSKEKAEESDLLKSSFLANMSHEIRTPMNGILGFVELLKEPRLTGEEQKEYINIIEESGTRMLNIINDIISISKVEAGHIEVVNTETNINDQLRFIYTFFKPEADRKGLQFNYNPELSDLEANIITDREKLYAIFTNLVKNAIKYTDNGTISFGYVRKGKFLEFYVKDTGVGIHLDQQSFIFERFRQASESLSRVYEGAGLGLAISKAYTDMLGGRIWLESELGKGSIFHFTIPFRQQNFIDVNGNKAVNNRQE